MGDAYRGLTIRIGADSTPLQRALSSITSAARSTSREVGRVGKALKLDPGNSDLMRLRISRLGDQSKTTASQIALMGTALNQALSGVKGGRGNLSYILKNAETDAANARRQFNTLNQSLEKVKDSIISYNMVERGMSAKEAEAAFREVETAARNSGNSVEYFEKVLRKAWSSNRSLIPFDTKDVDVAIAKWRELAETQVSTQRVLENANRNVGIKNMAVELEIAQSELKQMRIEAISAKNAMDQLGDSPGAREAASKTRLLSESVKEAETSFRSMMASSQALPKSVEAAAAQSRSFEQVARLLNEQMRTLEQRLKTLDGSKVSKIEAKFVTTGNAVRSLTDQAAGLEAEIEKLEAELMVLKERMDALPAGSKEFQRIEREVSDLNSRLRVTQGELNAVNVELRNANGAHAFRTASDELVALNGQLATHQAALAQANRRWGQLGATMRTAGYSWMATVGATTTILGMYAIQAANDIDAAYRNMRKTVNGTEADFEHLKQAALDYSQTHFTSADKLLEIEAIGGQLGVQVQNLEKYAEVVSNLDIATNVDTETMAQNLGQLSNIMNDMDQELKEGPGSMEAYSDALVRLGNNSAAQEDKIQNVMMRIASMGTISGMSTPDLLALATATAATGQGAEAAGTALSKTFSGIESAVNGSERTLAKLRESGNLTEDEIEDLTESIDAGNERLQAFADVAGMSADDFKRAWNETPMEAFKAFIQGLKDIDDAEGSVDSTLTGLKITSVRQKQTLQGLTQTVGILGNALTMSNDAWNGVSDQWGAAGDAAREAERKSEGFSGQLEMLKNNAKVLASTFLESLTPALTTTVDGLRVAVDEFEKLPEGAKQAIVAAAALGAATGPMMIFGGTALAAGSSFKSFVKGQQKGWTITKDALSAGGDALLVTSTLFDRHGRVATNSSKLAQRVGDKFLGAAAKLDTWSTKVASGGTALSKMSDGMLIAGEGIATLSGGAMGGIAVFGAMAGVCALAIADLSRYTKKTDAARDASNRLASATSNLASKTKDAFSAMSGDSGSMMAGSLDEALESYQEYVDGVIASQDKLADEAGNMRGKVLDIGTYSSDAATLMDKLKREGSLSELEFEQLTSIMDKFNQITNESIQVMRNEDGSISVLRNGTELTAEAFDKLAKAQENAAKADYFSKQYNAAFENKMEAGKNAQSLKQQLDAEQAKLDALRSNKPGIGSTWMDWQEYNKQIAEQEDKVKAVAIAYDEAASSEKTFTDQQKASVEMSALLKSELANTAGTLQNLIAGNDELISAFNNSNNSVNDFVSILGIAGLEAKDLKDADLASIVSNWSGSMPDLLQRLRDIGKVTDDELTKLSDLSMVRVNGETMFAGFEDGIRNAKGEVQDLANMEIDGIKIFVDDEGTIRDARGKALALKGDLEALNRVTINGKKVIVTDDGTILDEENKIIKLDGITIEGKTLYVTDDGSVAGNIDGLDALDAFKVGNKQFIVTAEGIYGEQGKLQMLDDFEIDGKHFYVTDDGSIISETGELYEFDELGIDPKDYIVDDGDTIRIQGEKIDDLRSRIGKVPKSIPVKASLDTSAFDRGIASLHEKIVSYNGKSIAIKTGTVPLTRNASGGFRMMASPSNVALHAAGAFITNGTTYIGSDRRGVHHIAGEAGREYVQRHADGTTSIIPLQNRKYMAPFASVVADMIGGAGGTVYNVTIQASGDADGYKLASDFKKGLKMQNMMKGGGR